MFNTDYHDWGDGPWVRGVDFYQTFVATGPYITRIATKLADKAGDHQPLTLNFAVYEPGQGPPSTWKQISPVRSRVLSAGTDPIIHIFWVAYRSSEVTLTPGKLYAVRFWRDPASPSPSFGTGSTCPGNTPKLSWNISTRRASRNGSKTITSWPSHDEDPAHRRLQRHQPRLGIEAQP
jgi:hypothetical protein